VSLSLLTVLAAASGCATDADSVDDTSLTSTTESALSANEQAAFSSPRCSPPASSAT
jgi:hypothetical protein